MTPAALAALARKYRKLAALRDTRDADGAPPTRAELRALAAEFPGCLRELDTLGGPELSRRAAACAAAATGGPTEPWMEWIATYHALMRGALEIRARARSAADDVALARAASKAAGLRVEVAFVAAVLAPPGGRVGVLVLRALATRFAVPAPIIAAALFPVRRPSPYRL